MDETRYAADPVIQSNNELGEHRVTFNMQLWRNTRSMAALLNERSAWQKIQWAPIMPEPENLRTGDPEKRLTTGANSCNAGPLGG